MPDVYPILLSFLFKYWDPGLLIYRQKTKKNKKKLIFIFISQGLVSIYYLE